MMEYDIRIDETRCQLNLIQRQLDETKNKLTSLIEGKNVTHQEI